MIEEYIKIKEMIENNEHEIKTSCILKNKTIRINLLLSTIFSFCFHVYFIHDWFLNDNGFFYYLFLAFAMFLIFLQAIETIMEEIEEIKDEKRKNIAILIALNLLIPLSFVVSPVYTLISIIFICTNSKYVKESEKRMKKLEIKNEKLKLKKLELWKKILNDKA
jgi:hypothetical protein